MRLSVVIEWLLILAIIAYSAYGRVIDQNQIEQRAISNSSKQSNVGVSTLSLKQATDNVNRYCTCNENICNCCRDFHIPLVQLQGPGCASLQYLQGDNLAVQLSFGDNILTSTIVNGKSPKPVCVPLPGGFTKFCGRIYSIQREAKNHFKACLGLELQSSTELEASLRVSCFRFGPDGLKLRPAEPLPVVETESPEEDDDDDIFGLGADDDDEEDDDDDNPSEISPLTNSVPDSSAEEDDDDDDDILGFGALLDIFTGDDETTTKKPKGTTAAPLLQFTIPLLAKPTPATPLNTDQAVIVGDSAEDNSNDDNEYIPVQSIQPEDNVAEDSDEFSVTEAVNEFEDTVTETSNKVLAYAKPGKLPTKKVTVPQINKKPSLTSTSINAIETETDQKKKPVKKPVKGDDDDNDDNDDDDDDDDDDILDDDDEEAELLSDDDEKDSEEEDEYEDEKEETEQGNAEDEDEKAEDLDDLVDDDDEEEDAMISALVYGDKENVKKRKVKKNDESSDADDDDYELGLSGLLARSRHSRGGRQSKVMRL
ncbi:uncharacterized protein LOC143207171 isoform X2 [Lasioglossum baleicum]